MGGQFPDLGTEPAIEGCVRTSRTALGLGARCCELGLEDSWDHGCLHSRESFQLTASAVMGRMETKAKYAGVPPRQRVLSTSVLLGHVKVLGQPLGFSIELCYMPCRDLWRTGPREKG